MTREHQLPPPSTDVTASSTNSSPSSQRASPTAPPRPPLQRLPRSAAVPRTSPAEDPRSPGPRPEDDHVSATETETDMSEDDTAVAHDGGSSADVEGPDRASPDELELERLRNLQLKILQQQQRQRMRNVAGNAGNTGLGARRVSPIKEEPVST